MEAQSKGIAVGPGEGQHIRSPIGGDISEQSDGALAALEAVAPPGEVRAVIGGVRQLHERQDFNFAGPWGDNGFIEDYNAEIHGRPLGAVHLITFNADGEAQHIAANYRPLSSVMFFSRLLRERLAGTPYAEHFLAGEA
jgi:hypothetical protein